MRVLAVTSDLCTGCGACEQICAMTFFKVSERAMSAIRVDELAGGGYRIAFCNQCGECVAVCPTEALYRSKSGIVRLRDNDCVGCMACVGFCPDMVMYAALGGSVPIKCVACGKCVDVCPSGALFMHEIDIPPVVTELTRSIRARTGAGSHGH